MSLAERLPSLRSFFSASAILWLSQIAGIAVAVVATVFVTRLLGPEGRGVYTWLLTLAGLGTHLALAGLDISNRRFAAAAPQQIPALTKLNLWVMGVIGVSVALLLGGFALWQPAAGGVALWVVLAMLTVPAGAVPMALGQILVAQGRITETAWMIFLPKLLLALGAGVLLWGAWVSVGSALAINLLAAMVGVVLPLWMLRGALQQPGHLQTLPYLRSVWKAGAASYAAGLSVFFMQKVDVLLVGFFLGKAATGYYGVASNLADIMITPASVLASLLGVRLAAGMRDKTGLIMATVVGMTALGCGAVYLLAPWLVTLLFGEAFSTSADLLRWLCPAVVAFAFFTLMQNALQATGRARYLAIPPLVGALANVALNLWWIPHYGLIGVCLASLVAYGLAGLVAMVLWWRCR